MPERSPTNGSRAWIVCFLVCSSVTFGAVAASCTTEDDGLGPRPIGPANPPPGTESCEDGQTDECHVTVGLENGILTCLDGSRTCVGGKWSACDGTYTAKPVAEGKSNEWDGDKALSFSDAQPCINNPCDPTCMYFDEVPPGGLSPPGTPASGTQGGGLTNLSSGYLNAGLQDIDHPFAAPCTGTGACQFDHWCDTTICNGNGCGKCVPWADGAYDATKTDPDYTMRVACQDALVACNRGGVAAPSGAKVVVMSGTPAQLEFNLGLCTGFQGSVASTCLTPSALAPGECVLVTGCTTPSPAGITINSSDYAPPLFTEANCANNWTIFENTVANCMTTSYSDSTHEEPYEAICPPATRVQWNYFTYHASTPSNSSGQSSIQVNVHTAEPPATISPGCLDCVQLADIPASEPETCLLTGPAPCPINLFAALGGAPKAHDSLLELVFDFSPSPAGTGFVYMREAFANNDKGWSRGPEWSIGALPGTAPDPATNHTPTGDNGVAGANIGGAISTTNHGLSYLTSPVVYLAVPDTVALSFWRWLEGNAMPEQTHRVEVFDGAAWQVLWEGSAMAVADSSWTEQTFDVTPYKNASFRVRFGFDMNGGVAVGGWNIDDLTIVGTSTGQAVPTMVDWELTYSCLDSE